MADNSTGVIIIALVLIGAMFIYPMLREDVGNISSDLWGTWKSLFEIAGGQGACSVGVHLEYADGSSDDYALDGQTPLMPLVVYIGDDPKALLAVDFQVWGTFSWDGTLQSISQSTDMDVWFDGVVKKSGSRNGPLTFLPSASNVPFLMHELHVTDDNIQSWAGSDGTFDSMVIVSSTLTIAFTDGTTETLTATDVSADFSFRVTGMAGMGTTSLLSVSINPDHWHDVPDFK